MINLPGGYAMDADDYCYIIGKPYRNPKDGKTTIAKKTYYAKLEDAIESVTERCARDAVASGVVTELVQLIDCINMRSEEMQKLIAGRISIKPFQVASEEDLSDEA